MLVFVYNCKYKIANENDNVSMTTARGLFSIVESNKNTHTHTYTVYQLPSTNYRCRVNGANATRLPTCLSRDIHFLVRIAWSHDNKDFDFCSSSDTVQFGLVYFVGFFLSLSAFCFLLSYSLVPSFNSHTPELTQQAKMKILKLKH